jgi:hypothetical protein
MAVENPFNQTLKYKATNKVKGIIPILDHVIVIDMDFSGRQLASGIVLLSDDGKSEGIRPRWAQVHSVGPDQHDVKPGQWIYVEHGRWTRGLHVEFEGDDHETVLRRVDPSAIIFKSDEKPDADDTFSTAVDGEKKERINWAEQ